MSKFDFYTMSHIHTYASTSPPKGKIIGEIIENGS